MTALRILLVEDDANICWVMAELLESMGHSVCATAATETEAVTAAGRCMPDLMIVDITLARGSGVAAVDRILQSGHIPHFFMSGVMPDHPEKRGPFLRKPFRAADLILSIEAALKPLQPELGFSTN